MSTFNFHVLAFKKITLSTSILALCVLASSACSYDLGQQGEAGHLQ